MYVTRVSVAIFATFFCAGPATICWGEGGNWEWYRSERFGYSLPIPADIFRPRVSSSNGQGVEFVSADGRGKLKVLAVYNADNIGPDEYRAEILRNLSGYNQVTYGPRGRTWFVLSGMRGPTIYYQKVAFSCGGRVINAFALTYPEEQRADYDAAVTIIEKNFHPTSGAACFALNR
jgi:hypothetical protein